MNTSALKIGIIGAGFTGTALAAHLHKMHQKPVEIYLCEKSGQFGAGPAYATPFLFHLLNVRVNDMSAYADEPAHFFNWLKEHPEHLAHFNQDEVLGLQFAPRHIYYHYLQDILLHIKTHPTSDFKVHFIPQEVIAVGNPPELILSNREKIKVDKVVLALGNHLPSAFPFPVSHEVSCIHNPWDYKAVNHIDKHAPVLIVGTGLSMIDAVLTLYNQQHEGVIHAVSRHGLLPLPHADVKPNYPIEKKALLDISFMQLTKLLRTISKQFNKEGGDWRCVLNAVRAHIPEIWNQASLSDKKRFLRHLLPYWNIHRHRVHTDIMDLLDKLQHQQQLNILSGRVQAIREGKAHIKLRHSNRIMEVPVSWVINCMGPLQTMQKGANPLIDSLLDQGIASYDPLRLGLHVNKESALLNEKNQISAQFYAAGAPTRGFSWEIAAVPELRGQIFALARHILAIK